MPSRERRLQQEPSPHLALWTPRKRPLVMRTRGAYGELEGAGIKFVGGLCVSDRHPITLSDEPMLGIVRLLGGQRKILAAGHESAVGRVSRVTPVQTALRNCTRDGGRPSGFGDQVADPKPP